MGQVPSFRIEHPSEPGVFAEYGTTVLGPFVMVSYKGRVFEALEPACACERPIHAVLETLVVWWFLGADDVAETLSLLVARAQIPPGLQVVAAVIENMTLVTR